MVSINTVTGKIESSDLGCTLVHEHLRVLSEEVLMQFPHLHDREEEFRKAVEQVNATKERGVKTICDPSVMGVGRDIHLMEKVAIETGVQVIAATGVYTYHYLPPHFQNRNTEYLADVFVRDIEVGIQNTHIKAGFIKCATDAQGITRDVEKVLRAAAKAHIRTDAPIMTHSHPASGTGLMQIDIFEQEGVDMNKVQIGHCGDTDDIDYLLKVLDKGVYIGMDRYGITSPIDTDRRNATVLELIRRGYAEQIFLSQDACGSMDWYKPEAIKKNHPKWSMTYIFDEVILI